MTIIGTVLITFAVMLGVIAAMAVGVMNGRKPISGSCGGLNGGGCELCSGSGKCQREGEQ
ncbi:MAG: Na(+)-translocating NADH-quinone reductase subunit E [Woeseiaceae bacterium]|nr:Na(+)-translocating NADH-quinone reductase subunit E [Woeseiaceae bacterium]